jgi:hypothetical protein
MRAFERRACRLREGKARYPTKESDRNARFNPRKRTFFAATGVSFVSKVDIALVVIQDSGFLIVLEFFDPRSHFHFRRPSAAWLAQYVPIVGGNRIRIEHGVWFVCWLRPPCAANAAVDHEMRDVDTLGR